MQNRNDKDPFVFHMNIDDYLQYFVGINHSLVHSNVSALYE